MEIEWLNNSTFLIKTSLGKRILIDPFNALKVWDTNIDSNIITLSKNISKNLFSKEVKIICNNESYFDKDIKIKSYLSYSDKLNGLKRGENYIYTYEVDLLKFCHLGYLGEILNEELINTLKFMDFLFIPIGGNMCLDGYEAYKLGKLLSPKYIIPMCYNANNYDFYFDGPKKLLSCTKDIIKLNSNIIDTHTLKQSSKPLTLLLSQ